MAGKIAEKSGYFIGILIYKHEPIHNWTRQPWIETRYYGVSKPVDMVWNDRITLQSDMNFGSYLRHLRSGNNSTPIFGNLVVDE